MKMKFLENENKSIFVNRKAGNNNLKYLKQHFLKE